MSRRTDHDRHHPVGKTTDQGGHNHEENHDKAVSCGEHKVHVLTGIDCRITLVAIDHGSKTMENLNTGLLELGTRWQSKARHRLYPR